MDAYVHVTRIGICLWMNMGHQYTCLFLTDILGAVHRQKYIKSNIYNYFAHLGSPVTERVLVFVSDCEYNQLNETTQADMRVCQTLGSPVANPTLIEAAYGRYLYISLIRDTAYNGYFQLYEVDVCMGRWIKYLHEMNIVH